MAFFSKKTWKDRLVEYAGRRKITNVSTMVAQIVDVERAEGIVSEEGNALSAANMNDLEQRVADGFTSVQRTTDTLNQNLSGYQFGTVDGVPSYKAGADAAWVPFKREPIIEKASFSWAYSPSQTFPAKEGYKIVGLYADITGINSNSAVNINFGISKNLSTGKIAISGQTYVNIMGAFYCIYA